MKSEVMPRKDYEGQDEMEPDETRSDETRSSELEIEIETSLVDALQSKQH